MKSSLHMGAPGGLLRLLLLRWLLASTRGLWMMRLHVGFLASRIPMPASSAVSAPHPHGVDLLRNRNPDSPLGAFDGKVAAWAQIGAKHYYITTNADYVPAVPSLETPHAVYLRTDMRYGTDDLMLWPQQYTPFYCHLALISKRGSRPELDVMWWTPTRDDFQVGSAVTRGLGRLTQGRFSKFLPPVNELVPRCKALRGKPQGIPLFGQLIQQLLMWLEQLQTLPTTFPKMLFAITSMQRTFLELDALFNYMTVYKERMNDYMVSAPTDRSVRQFVGAFTSNPNVAQQLWAARIPVWLLREYILFDAENILAVVPLTQPSFALADPNAHGEGAPPALYTGNSTFDKIQAIQRAACQTPWYHDPFETGFTRPATPTPAPSTLTVAVPVASPSRAVGPPQPNRQQNRYKPYSPAPAKSSKSSPSIAKHERDKFLPVEVVEMPPSIASFADALPKVDRAVVPYTTDAADKRYILPEPALLVQGTPERRHKFLHHWNLLADGFMYMLTQPRPQLLSAQQWRDILEGLVTERSTPGSRTQRRSSKLEDLIRPALEASNVTTIEGFPVPVQLLPDFSVEQTREIIWQVAETGFRFELCALDRRASGKRRLDEVRVCFAGHMLVRAPLVFSKQGWAAPTLQERHRYVGRTACLMLDWTTKTHHPDIIRRVQERLPWSPEQMQSLKTAVCRYYTQAFWEYFGRAAVLPMRLEHELEKEEGEI
ncbi:hypothetical protein C8R44DRAFT_732908 [Mycena epipterygia]|nr:hypothetical protein C8R44DRAFT_732908 [Mycena epipterygia]